MSGILYKYHDYIDLEGAQPISMGEGSTPLIFSDYLSDRTGAKVYLKLEGSNPTGSFKDRGMVVAVCKALQSGKKVLVCASTGNTSASASAYAARYGLISTIIVPGKK